MFENTSIPELKIRSINVSWFSSDVQKVSAKWYIFSVCQNLEFGTIDKIYLEFSEPWWPTECGGFNLLWTEKEREEYAKEVSIIITYDLKKSARELLNFLNRNNLW